MSEVGDDEESGGANIETECDEYCEKAIKKERQHMASECEAASGQRSG